MATDPLVRAAREPEPAEPEPEAEPAAPGGPAAGGPDAEPRVDVALTPPQILGGFVLLAALVLFLRRRARRR